MLFGRGGKGKDAVQANGRSEWANGQGDAKTARLGTGIYMTFRIKARCKDNSIFLADYEYKAEFQFSKKEFQDDDCSEHEG